MYLILAPVQKIRCYIFDELTELAKIIPAPHYIPVLSREQWEGEHGYVHKVYRHIIKEKKKMVPPSHFLPVRLA